jgi:zinc finger-like protein
MSDSAAPVEDIALVTLFSGWACKGHPQNLSSAGSIRCLSSIHSDECPVMRMKRSAGVETTNMQSGSILPPPDLKQNSIEVGSVHGPDDSLESLDTRAPKRPRGGEMEERSGDSPIEDTKSRNRCGGASTCCAPGLGCGSISARPSGPTLLPYTASSTSSSLNSGLFGWGNDKGPISDSGPKPIDHIFQFHKAIRKDLEYLDIESAKLSDCDEDFLRQFQGRFQFLWGLYRAHSNAEDDIVFPALEAKEALHNVSHSYTIDHKQEEQLFKDIAEVSVILLGPHVFSNSLPFVRLFSLFGDLLKCPFFLPAYALQLIYDSSLLQVLLELSTLHTRIENDHLETEMIQRRNLAGKLQRMCKSIRVSLDHHVSREEKELWPLFGVHFSIEEQDQIVGRIIGTTGAEVLQVWSILTSTS